MHFCTDTHSQLILVMRAAANAALTITRNDNYKVRALEIESRFRSWIESKERLLVLLPEHSVQF